MNHFLRIEGNPTDDNFKLTFDYSFLRPDSTKKRKKAPILNSKIEKGDKKEVIEFTKQSPPCDTEFIQKNNVKSDVDFIKDVAENIQFKHLMAHPTITSFLWMQGSKMLPYYYFNAAFCLVFYTILTSWILKMTEDIDSNNVESAETAVLKWTTFTFLVVFTFKQIIQIMVSSCRHMIQFENILETILIIVTFCLMFDPLETRPKVAQWLTLSEDAAVRIMSACILLMSWMLMFCILGNHPQWSELSTLVAMFGRVSFNFFKYLVFFMVLVIAYGFCFYIQFRNPKGEKMPGDLKPHNEYFSSLRKAMLKTIAMSLSGDIFSSIEIDSFGWFGWALFISFIFFIFIVLSNLLNGLAVSDIRQLKDEAKVRTNVQRLKCIRRIEAIFQNKKYSNLFIKFLLFPFLICETVLGDSLFLFSKRLPNRQAVFYPNKSNKEQSGKGKLDISLPESMLEEAKRVVLNKTQETDKDLMKREIEKNTLALVSLASELEAMKKQSSDQLKELIALLQKQTYI